MSAPRKQQGSVDTTAGASHKRSFRVVEYEVLTEALKAMEKVMRLLEINRDAIEALLQKGIRPGRLRSQKHTPLYLTELDIELDAFLLQPYKLFRSGGKKRERQEADMAETPIHSMLYEMPIVEHRTRNPNAGRVRIPRVVEGWRDADVTVLLVLVWMKGELQTIRVDGEYLLAIIALVRAGFVNAVKWLIQMPVMLARIKALSNDKDEVKRRALVNFYVQNASRVNPNVLVSALRATEGAAHEAMRGVLATCVSQAGRGSSVAEAIIRTGNPALLQGLWFQGKPMQTFMGYTGIDKAVWFDDPELLLIAIWEYGNAARSASSREEAARRKRFLDLLCERIRAHRVENPNAEWFVERRGATLDGDLGHRMVAAKHPTNPLLDRVYSPAHWFFDRWYDGSKEHAMIHYWSVKDPGPGVAPDALRDFPAFPLPADSDYEDRGVRFTTEAREIGWHVHHWLVGGGYVNQAALAFWKEKAVPLPDLAR